MTSDHQQGRFSRQFIIALDPRPVPAGMERRALGRATLDTAPDLPIVKVMAGAAQYGVLLGWPVDLTRRAMASGTFAVPPRQAGETIDDWVETAIYDRLGGSFIYIHSGEGDPLVYLDANGSLSAVFDPVARALAATPDALLGDAYDDRLDLSLASTLDVAVDGWYPAGLTAHRGVRRQMANHRVDLATGEHTRHWPRGPFSTSAMSEADAIDAIGEECAAWLEAASAAAPTIIHLTGGNESRLMLACARGVLDRVSFVTVENENGEMDYELAARLAGRFALRHRILPPREASAAEQALWDRRTGHSMGGWNRAFHTTVEPLGDGFVVGGLGGEIGRAFLWQDGAPTHRPNAEELIVRLKLTDPPALRAAVDAWLSALPPDLDPVEILELAYIELRMSSWAYTQAYTQPWNVTLNPLTSRGQFTRMLALPLPMRRANGIARAVVARRWPELLDIPINAYGDWRDTMTLLVRAIKRPDRALRKARRILRLSRIEAGRT